MPVVFRYLTRDGWLHFATCVVRLFAYGSLSADVDRHPSGGAAFRRGARSKVQGIAAATRNACDTIVRVGFTATAPGIVDPSAMYKPAWVVFAADFVLNT